MEELNEWKCDLHILMGTYVVNIQSDTGDTVHMAESILLRDTRHEHVSITDCLDLKQINKLQFEKKKIKQYLVSLASRNEFVEAVED